ncbi:MAG TPA: SGNH/GDSL hydrolase family protein [Rhizobiaceae bacterium]
MATESVRRITLEDLKKRIKKGELSDRQLRGYFEVDEDNTEAFAPALRLNYARVDTGGRELSPEETAELFQQAMAKRPPEPKLEAAAPAIKVLAEGDSWFNLPDLLYPKDAMDMLNRTHSVVSVAKWGDTVENMLAQKQYVQKLKAGTFRHFLFSGGGNDVLGSIGTYVKTRKPGDTDPANAPDYVKPSFATKVKGIISGYETLANDVRKTTGAKTVLYIHGYANAIPKKDGPYLGKRMEALGFDPAAIGLLSKAIVANMVGQFNTALKNFAASRAGIVYIDMRPRMSANDWHTDEIHPKASGATKIAAAFAAAINANAAVS